MTALPPMPRAATAPAPTAPPVRDWGIIVMKVAGHGLSQDIQHGLDQLAAAGTSKSAYLTVRAEQNGKYSDYTVTDSTAAGPHLAPAAGGVQDQDSKSKPILARDNMVDFLRQTMRQYPARHYMISFEAHGKVLRQAVQDMHDALAVAAQECGHKIDVMALDACFLAQIEAASQFQDVAGILVGSQEAMEGWRPSEKLSQRVDQSPTSPQQAAEYLVSINQDFTLSAMDLSKVGTVNPKIKAFGEDVLQVQDERGKRHLRRAIRSAQHFYTLGLTSPNGFHNTVDIYDFVQHVLQDPYLTKGHPHLMASGNNLLAALKPGPGQMVFAEKHSPTVVHTAELDYYDVRAAHGVSMYLPTTPALLRDRYTHFNHSQFNQETNWDRIIDHLTKDNSAAYELEGTAEDVEGNVLAGANLVINEAVDWEKDRRKAS